MEIEQFAEQEGFN